MDLKFVAASINDKVALLEWLRSDDWPYHGQATFEHIENVYFGDSVETFWIVADGSERVGLLRLYDLEDYTPMFDIRVLSPHRGSGIGTKSVKWLTNYIFTKWPGKGRIEGYTRRDNTSMRRVFKKCGYVKEAHHRSSWPGRNGQMYDSIGYCVLRVDWEKNILTPVDWEDE